ncbi:MAG: hypothetical protein MUF54_05625 [Polyangiaceae bacterium]|jgi:arsenate reductase-like glutaredoxin family protein|nr:hypothetical protein [Polyangiaceae bacterium]
MVIQVFGTQKCKRSRAAERFFRERRIQMQFIDLPERGLSAGEFDSVMRAVGLENMIDTQSREYERLGLKHLSFDIEAKLRENPRLLVTPIVRNGAKATVGLQQETWKAWIKNL